MPITALHRPATVAMLACAALLPAACKQETPPAQEAADAVPGAPEAPDGISVTNARLVLPPVTGNPGAVYFDIANASDRPVSVAAAAVTGAGMSMLHTTRMQGSRAAMEHVEEAPVPAGGAISFAPGSLHVMVHDLGPGVVAGSTAEVTLTFADGDKVSFPAAVQTVGGGS